MKQSVETVHIIPLAQIDDFPDHPFQVKNVWTPAGMIEAVRNANGIIIDGTVYDDWYQG